MHIFLFFHNLMLWTADMILDKIRNELKIKEQV